MTRLHRIIEALRGRGYWRDAAWLIPLLLALYALAWALLPGGGR
ncbi:MAG TPA: hypothetical protein PLE19_12880 [Planctomycetota bacterium]|nr:hypothetical protein [Planctomycetota bacterium]HRR82932.1 hypothetical protein [Planctomycetota bacterium]HRT94788.1 hypothetical protein [Planctomycetota bacterium]